MTVVRQVTLFYQVAVTDKQGEALTVSLNSGAETGQDIGLVEKVSDATETVWFALGTEHGARGVKPFQAGIFIGLNFSDDFECKLLWELINCQVFRINPELVLSQRCTVQYDFAEFQFATVKAQRGL